MYLFFKCITVSFSFLRIVIWIFLQNHKSFHDWRQRNICRGIKETPQTTEISQTNLEFPVKPTNVRGLSVKTKRTHHVIRCVCGGLASGWGWGSCTTMTTRTQQTWLHKAVCRARPLSVYTKQLFARIHSSVASSALSPYARSTGVVCVWNPVIDFGLPAWPTTSTAYKENSVSSPSSPCNKCVRVSEQWWLCLRTCPTRTDTGSGRNSSSNVTNILGCMAVTKLNMM